MTANSTGKKGKNPAAVALGRLGGAKGGAAKRSPEKQRRISSEAGKARARKLSPEDRSEIASKASLARWTKKGSERLSKRTTASNQNPH